MKRIIFNFCFAWLAVSAFAGSKVVEMRNYGLVPNTHENLSPKLQKALQDIKSQVTPGDKVTLLFESGRYDFHPEGAAVREYYISNHDQDNPKTVGFPLEDWKELTVDGQGADFIFHGRMLPLSLLRSENCTLRNFSIDFETPQITQVKVLKNGEEGITFEPAAWVKCRINDKGFFESYGEGCSNAPQGGIAFEEKTKRLVYHTSDLWCPMEGVKEVSPRVYQAPQWKDARLIPGTVIALRTYYRPAPGIFLSNDKDTRLQNVKVHYAEGMGLMAQLCENITLDEFSVCLRGDQDPRYFTTQADATHFSSCRGKIDSRNGLYEGMMDDAINVHGTYLKIKQRLDDHTVIAQYMHPQAYGFEWGVKGDEVQFVRSSTMELTGGKNRVKEILPHDKDTVKGAKEYRITFTEPLDAGITDKEGFGIENLSWCPEVYFADNVIRNNRARGTLFSTPLKTVVERNLFDHTSGTAILLCGDCNGWFETGACRNVLIRNNRFINALTNMFQFTEAVISIYPEIPDLEHQKKYFHGGEGEKGVVIEDNYFETFDRPILFAKSIDGLVFKNNVIRQNTDYPAFHANKSRFRLLRTKNVKIEKNDFEDGDESVMRE